MDLNRIPIFAALRSRMAWANERQSVIAQNVANADTPDYKAADLAPLDFKALTRSFATASRLQTTDTKHFALGPGTEDGQFRRDTSSPFEVSPSKNAVSLETEMMKVAETQATYETALNLYHKQMGMIRIALGKG